MKPNELQAAVMNFIERYGKNAAEQATRRADELANAGFVDCSGFWRQVAEEIELRQKQA